MSREKVIETFDAWADEGRDAGMEEGHGDVVAQVVEALDVRPGERILDLGCGNGWGTRLLARANAGVQAIGIDCSPRMIARADELHSFTIRARYDLGDFEDLDFPDGDFDRVFSMEALYYADDLPRTIAEIHRVLKPGGRAEVVVDHYRESPATADWGERMGLPLHFLSEADWRAAFEAAGFLEVETLRVHDRRPAREDDPHREVREAGSLWIRARKPSL